MDLGCFVGWFVGFFCQGWLYNCWILCNKAFELRKLHLAVSLAPSAVLRSDLVLLLPCCVVLTPNLKLNLALPVLRGGKEGRVGFSSKQPEMFLLSSHVSSFAFCLSPHSTAQWGQLTGDYSWWESPSYADQQWPFFFPILVPALAPCTRPVFVSSAVIFGSCSCSLEGLE